MSSQIEGVVPSPSDSDRAEAVARPTIASRAEACYDLLIRSSDFLHVYKDGGTRWVRLRDLAGRFNIWTSNMGAFAELHASLDYRLRDLADVKELILEHLENMVDRMAQLITFLNDLKLSSDPVDDADYESQSEPAGHEEIDAILSSFSTSIDWLHRLANMVRRASTSRQNTKASAFALKDPQGVDTTPALERLFSHWITRDFPTIDNDLRNRLVSTMLLRRRRVLYRRSRQAKLALRTAKPTSRPAHSTIAASSAVGGLTIPGKMPWETKVPTLLVPALSTVAPTHYTATTVEPETYRRLVSTPSKVSRAHTFTMTSGNKEMIPLPPRIAPNALEFICPFCCLILPATDARDRNAWGAHIKKDLDPYICPFFPCAHGEDILGTSADWISHMQQTHCMRWYCAAKAHRSDMFASQEEYVEHMKAKHPGKFIEAQLPFLAENSRRPLKRIFDACPLCGEEAGEKEKSLEDHIAHHLQYLALLSLPLLEDTDSAEDASTISGTDSRGEEKVDVSRTTVKSERHLMPPAIFSYEDDSPSDTARAVDDTIPDIEEQKRIDIAQSWQIIRMRKFNPRTADQLITEAEQRRDRVLAGFILRFESMLLNNDVADALSEFKRKLKHDWRRTNFEDKVFYVRDEIYRWMVAGKPTNAVRLLATVNQGIKSGKFPEIRSLDLFNPGATCFIVFAILLSLDYGHLIHIFHKHNVTDQRLDWNIEESSDAYDAIRKDLKNEHPDPAKAITEFERAKWAFIPVPLELMMHKTLHGVNWILPFSKCSKIAAGGTATVYQVLVQEELLPEDFRTAISAGRQTHGSLKVCYEFAIKEYTEAFEAGFERESLAFKAMRGQEGMVQFLGQFVRDRNNADGIRETTYNILLEYGEFDLEEFFGEPQQYPPVEQLEIVLFWESFFKVADAISRVHNLKIKTEDGQTKRYNGWHADIKPENILRVYGEFKLADFGFATFSDFKGSGHLPTNFIDGGTAAYGAPETDITRRLRGTLTPMSQTIDTWSFGCVLSFTATWVILGVQGVYQYHEVRKAAISKLDKLHRPSSDVAFHNGDTVLPEALDWHRLLRESMRKCDPITDKILDLIEETMWVASPTERIQCEDLCKKLDSFLEDAHRACHRPEISITSRVASPSRPTIPLTIPRACPRINPYHHLRDCDEAICKERVRLDTVKKNTGFFRKPKKDAVLKDQIRARHFIFVVDRAPTMLPCWEWATFLVETLAIKLARIDDDGIDLVFTNGDEYDLKEEADASNLKAAMERAEPRINSPKTDMSLCLGEIFRAYGSNFRKKKLTLLIITDGMWGVAFGADELRAFIDPFTERELLNEFIDLDRLERDYDLSVTTSESASESPSERTRPTTIENSEVTSDAPSYDLNQDNNPQRPNAATSLDPLRSGTDPPECAARNAANQAMAREGWNEPNAEPNPLPSTFRDHVSPTVMQETTVEKEGVSFINDLTEKGGESMVMDRRFSIQFISFATDPQAHAYLKYLDLADIIDTKPWHHPQVENLILGSLNIYADDDSDDDSDDDGQTPAADASSQYSLGHAGPSALPSQSLSPRPQPSSRSPSRHQPELSRSQSKRKSGFFGNILKKT